MKKLIIIAILFLFSGLTFGQTLPKGTLIGTHTMNITLSSGVTMEQFIQFLQSKWIPEFNKIDPDWQVYLVKGIRGNINPESYGLVHVLKSDQVRSKYYNPDGSTSELYKSTSEKFKPVMEELSKLGTFTTQWTDWIVQ